MYSKVFQYLWMRRDRGFRERIFRYRRELEQNEQFSTEQLQELQWQRLKQLLEHSYQNVPFYRRRFDQAGLHPDAVKLPEDFRKIPILTRRDVQSNLEDLVATNYERKRLMRNATGGSTGSPTFFYQDEEYKAYKEAAKMRFRRWFGFEMGDKVAILWGADRDIPTRSWAERQRVRFVKRELWLNSYNITPDKMEMFARQLSDWSPRYILGYASSVYLFASFLRERGIKGIRPVAVETSAEKLWDWQRKTIEDVFQCHIIDSYGSREISGVAAECDAHEGLHVFNDIRLVEVLHEGRAAEPGEVGEIVITDLTNLAMPFIRYQNGDLARASGKSCSCGRPFPLLAEIVGRSNDVLFTPNGQYVHGAFFNHLFFGVDGVRRFQVYQKSLHEVAITIERDADLSESTLRALHQKVMNHLGPGIELSFSVARSIPPTPTGKFRYIISEVALPFVTPLG